jgi:hypothetical protein
MDPNMADPIPAASYPVRYDFSATRSSLPGFPGSTSGMRQAGIRIEVGRTVAGLSDGLAQAAML